MPIAKLTLEIEIHHAQSLKDRRQVVRSVRDTLRRGFNVSVAEMDEALVWNRATLGVVALSRSSTYLNGQVEQASSAARRACTRFGAEVTDAYMELLTSDDSDVSFAAEPPLPLSSVEQPASPGVPSDSATAPTLKDRNA